MSYCPTCGKSLDKDPKFHQALCTACGTAVQLPSRTAGVASFTRLPERGEIMEDGFCLKCGQRIRGHAKFCGACAQARALEIPSIY